MSSWLEIDPPRFRERFDREPFLVRHRLVEHPLFSLPRLVELARTYPRTASNTTRATCR